MNRTYKLLIALGLVISASLVVVGITVQNHTVNTINNLTNNINNLTSKEILLNQTANSVGENWIQLYPNAGAPSYDGFGSPTNLGFEVNKTLGSQLNALQTQINDVQTQINSAQSNRLGINLIIAGIIGFGIVGLCCLIGYAIHRHIITLVNRKQVSLGKKNSKKIHKQKITKYLSD